MNKNNEVVVGLVKNRHEIPVREYIFESIENVLDFEALETTVLSFLEKKVGICKKYSCGLNQSDYSDVQCFCGERRLVLYITGLTTGVAAVIKLCALNGIQLTLMHFDASNGTYVPQRIF